MHSAFEFFFFKYKVYRICNFWGIFDWSLWNEKLFKGFMRTAILPTSNSSSDNVKILSQSLVYSSKNTNNCDITTQNLSEVPRFPAHVPHLFIASHTENPSPVNSPSVSLEEPENWAKKSFVRFMRNSFGIPTAAVLGWCWCCLSGGAFSRVILKVDKVYFSSRFTSGKI